jgi:hypothetical protein
MATLLAILHVRKRKAAGTSSAGVIIPRLARVPREYLALTGTVKTEHFDV